MCGKLITLGITQKYLNTFAFILKMRRASHFVMGLASLAISGYTLNYYFNYPLSAEEKEIPLYLFGFLY